MAVVLSVARERENYASTVALLINCQKAICATMVAVMACLVNYVNQSKATSQRPFANAWTKISVKNYRELNAVIIEEIIPSVVLVIFSDDSYGK